jgi:hypothetical protein
LKRLLIGIGVALALSPAASLAQAPSPTCNIDPEDVNCNFLCVNVETSEWVIDIPLTESLYCVHGKFALPAPTSNQAGLSSDGLFGPDCLLGFRNLSTGATAVVEVQQNLCVLEGPAISVTPTLGAVPEFTTQVGSFSNQIPGLITITGFDATSCVGCDADRPTGKVSRIGADKGSVKFSGRFTVAGPLDLGAASVTLQRILHEIGGAGELLTDGSGNPIAPLTLVARRGSSSRSAIFETPAGQRPAVRLELKTKRGDLELSLRVDRATIQAPTLCDGADRPQTDLHNVGLTIDDGTNAPVSLAPLHRWACRADKTGAVTELKLVESLLSTSPAGP